MSTFVPTTYFTAEAALGRIVGEVADMGQRLENLRAAAGQIEAQIANVFLPAPTGWDGMFAFIDDQAAALPNDTTWQALKARKDVLLKDFRDFQARAQGITTAIAGL